MEMGPPVHPDGITVPVAASFCLAKLTASGLRLPPHRHQSPRLGLVFCPSTGHITFPTFCNKML